MARPISFRKLLRDETGAAVVSYAVLVFIIGLALGIGASLTGVSLQTLFGTTASKIERSINKPPGA